MALQLYEVPTESSMNSSTISSIHFKEPELICKTEKLCQDLTLEPSNLPNNDVYEEITKYTTADYLDVNNTENPIVNCETENLYVDLTLDPLNPHNNDVYEDPIAVNTTDNPLYVNTTDNPLDVNTTDKPRDVNTTANPLDVNTTDKPRDVNTTANPLDVNTTDKPRDVNTTANPLDVNTTDKPRDVNTTANPLDVNTTDKPRDVNTTANPLDVNTTDKPRDVNTTANPLDVNTTDKPRDVNTTANPLDVNTTDKPRDVNTTANPLDVNTTDKPRDVNTTANPLDVNTTDKPRDVNTTANPLDVNTTDKPRDVNTTANPLDVNTTDKPRNVNTTAVTLPVNSEPEPSWWRKRTSKWLIGAVTVAVCVGVIVWIATEINWTRKEEDISPITTYTTRHPASEINRTSKDKKHGKGKNYLQAVRQDSFIGFTAWAQSPIEYSGKKVIIFTGVQQNEGGFYSTATGLFLCNVTGVYYITVTLKRTADVDGKLYILIYKGVEKLLVITIFDREKVGMSITKSKLVVCLSGEFLSMRGGYRGGSVYGESGVPHSTFTAFLMQETETRSKKQGSFVGFSAAKYSPQFYVNGDTIEFHKVIFKDGGHFKPATNSSNTAVIRCQQNETIVIKGTEEGRVDGGPEEESTFTVMLLQADATLRNASVVAFSVYKKTSQSYRAGDTISFGGVIMNEGNYFVADQFVCLNSGIFYVSLNAKKSGVKPLSLDVKVQTVTVLHLESIEAKSLGITTSGSVLAMCRSNEVIQVTAAAEGEVYGHQVERHTTFSVIMMYHN